jgi:hypothetical protein
VMLWCVLISTVDAREIGAEEVSWHSCNTLVRSVTLVDHSWSTIVTLS